MAPRVVIPKYVFIVPYRDREAFMNIYLNHMPWILEDIKGQYQILFCHQNDERPFNRGAMKNLGFYHVKKTYPKNYKSINFIFQDVDTLPGSKGLMDFNVEKGEVKHYYGFKFALGGIISIKGEDFEKINGFANFWGWGLEDNVLQKRCEAHKITINREQFYPYNSKHITQYHIGSVRTVDNHAINKAKNLKSINGLSEFYDVKYKTRNMRKDFIFMLDFKRWEITEKHNSVSFRNHNTKYRLKDKSVKQTQNKNTNNNSNIVTNRNISMKSIFNHRT